MNTKETETGKTECKGSHRGDQQLTAPSAYPENMNSMDNHHMHLLTFVSQTYQSVLK